MSIQYEWSTEYFRPFIFFWIIDVRYCLPDRYHTAAPVMNVIQWFLQVVCKSEISPIEKLRDGISVTPIDWYSRRSWNKWRCLASALTKITMECSLFWHNLPRYNHRIWPICKFCRKRIMFGWHVCYTPCILTDFTIGCWRVAVIASICSTVKPVYNDHLMGYSPAFWSSLAT